VPSFVTAAILAGRTDAIVTVPLSMASALAAPMNLRVFPPPVKLPKIDVAQYWHERFHREPGNQWIRGVFSTLFTEPKL
jgi:DNA-binding transcriptional LysR family regulator